VKYEIVLVVYMFFLTDDIIDKLVIFSDGNTFLINVEVKK